MIEKARRIMLLVLDRLETPKLIYKLSASATFTSDLGLDSLDAVEVVMAIEEEFGIEIPDAEADEITTVKQGKFSLPSFTFDRSNELILDSD